MAKAIMARLRLCLGYGDGPPGNVPPIFNGQRLADQNEHRDRPHQIISDISKDLLASAAIQNAIRERADHQTSRTTPSDREFTPNQFLVYSVGCVFLLSDLAVKAGYSHLTVSHS
jgi:hypothetical protein